jgi:hypothetical protein
MKDKLIIYLFCAVAVFGFAKGFGISYSDAAAWVALILAIETSWSKV